MYIDSQGYVVKEWHKREHAIIAEHVLGKPLPSNAEVHHVNHDRSDNQNHNLVICQDRPYHVLLHYRTRALDATGNADALKCTYCGAWSVPPHTRDLVHFVDKHQHRRVWHRRCNLASTQRGAARRREQGKCVGCSQPRGEDGTTQHCRPCANRINARQNKQRKGLL